MIRSARSNLWYLTHSTCIVSILTVTRKNNWYLSWLYFRVVNHCLLSEYVSVWNSRHIKNHLISWLTNDLKNIFLNYFCTYPLYWYSICPALFFSCVPSYSFNPFFNLSKYQFLVIIDIISCYQHYCRRWSHFCVLLMLLLFLL